jgi:hypothetical protein
MDKRRDDEISVSVICNISLEARYLIKAFDDGFVEELDKFLKSLGTTEAQIGSLSQYVECDGGRDIGNVPTTADWFSSRLDRVPLNEIGAALPLFMKFTTYLFDESYQNWDLEIHIGESDCGDIYEELIASYFNENAFSMEYGLDLNNHRDSTSDYFYFSLLERTEVDPRLGAYHEDLARRVRNLVEAAEPSFGVRSSNSYGIMGLSREAIAKGDLLGCLLRKIGELDPDTQSRGAYDLIADVARLIEPVMKDIVAHHDYAQILKDHETAIDIDYTLDGGKIATSAFQEDYLRCSPAGPLPTHDFSLTSLPIGSPRALLGTIALHHAELHLLGETFWHPVKRWQALVHEIAGLIVHLGPELPKWQGYLAQATSAKVH